MQNKTSKNLKQSIEYVRGLTIANIVTFVLLISRYIYTTIKKV